MADTTPGSLFDEPDAALTERGSAARWISRLQLASRDEQAWRTESAAITDRYRGDCDSADGIRRSGKVNILASTMELLQPSVFARAPRPSVRRRQLFESSALSQVGRLAAMALEKVLSFLIDDSGFGGQMHRISLDMLLTGRGVGRVVLDTEMIKRRDLQQVEDPVLGTVWVLDGMAVEPEQDEEGPYVEIKASETVRLEHVYWSDFRLSPARCWDDVSWIAFRHTMTRRQLRDEFGDELASEIALNETGVSGDATMRRAGIDGSPADPPSRKSRAVVWEIWSKDDLERIWISEGSPNVLRVDPDPLGLEGFWPCAEPVRHIAPTDSLEPVPEFRWWRTQADELDVIQTRIKNLLQSVKAVLIVDGELSEVIKVADAPDGTAIPLERPGEAAGDLANAIFQWPFGAAVAAINELSQRSEMLKAQIFELSGVSDIMRGSVQERESAAASKFKVGFGRVRQTPRSAPVARFVEDTLRIMGEVVAEHFDPATIAQISGMQLPMEVPALLRDEKLRNVVLEISDRDMIAQDLEAEKAEAVELVQALTGFSEQFVGIAQAVPAMTPLLMATLKLALRPFRASREIEDLIDTTTRLIVQQALAPQQAPQPQPGAVMAPQPGMMQ